MVFPQVSDNVRDSRVAHKVAITDGRYKLTAENLVKELPIYLDGELLANPRVAEPITGGFVRLSLTDWNPEQLKALAALLSSEPLPAKLTIHR